MMMGIIKQTLAMIMDTVLNLLLERATPTVLRVARVARVAPVQRTLTRHGMRTGGQLKPDNNFLVQPKQAS